MSAPARTLFPQKACVIRVLLRDTKMIPTLCWARAFLLDPTDAAQCVSCSTLSEPRAHTNMQPVSREDPRSLLQKFSHQRLQGQQKKSSGLIELFILCRSQNSMSCRDLVQKLCAVCLQDLCTNPNKKQIVPPEFCSTMLFEPRPDCTSLVQVQS